MPNKQKHHLSGMLGWVLCAVMMLGVPGGALAVDSGVESAKAATVAISMQGSGNIGSGVVAQPGYVITAAHVVDAGSPSSMMVVTARGDGYDFDVAAIDRQLDVAVLRVPDLTDAGVVWGDSTNLVSGDDVYALGYALGSEQLVVTGGIVSVAAQEIDSSGGTYIQTDATINPGNSGGPLVDANGAFVGINVMKLADIDIEGVGLAVPEADIRALASGEGISFGASTGGLEGDVANVPAGAGSTGSDGSMFILGLAAVGVAIAIAMLATNGVKARDAGHAVVSPPPVAARVASSAESALVRLGVRSAGAPETERTMNLPGIIGRASSADMQVADERVSREHVRVSLDPEGFCVQDLGSRNGTFVGDGRVERLVISTGDSFRIGDTKIRVLGR